MDVFVKDNQRRCAETDNHLYQIENIFLVSFSIRTEGQVNIPFKDLNFRIQLRRDVIVDADVANLIRKTFLPSHKAAAFS